MSCPRRLLLLGVALLTGCGGSAIATNSRSPTAATTSRTPSSAVAIDITAVPLGDGHVGSTPRIGYVDSCTTSFGNTGGAFRDGPWINAAAKTWNYRTKLAVKGQVRWPSASYTVRTTGAKRVIRFNDLPINHATGVFPISSSDPAYAYDRNPNHIAAQTASWTLPLHPTAATKPVCTPGGPIGVLSDGVRLYNALDGEGRDAGAHEVLDSCAGHPDQSSSYHHHDVPPCILAKAPNGRATLVGYAADGYGIYVVKSASGTLPRNAQLDACHGSTSPVVWDGGRTRIFHYVATLEYPYTVGCFHGTPISTGQGTGGPSAGGPPGGGPPGA